MSASGRYLLFGGEDYYPGGGALDLAGRSDDLAALAEQGRARFGARFQWWHVFDLETMAEVTDAEIAAAMGDGAPGPCVSSPPP
jgi:hypothetical protein